MNNKARFMIIRQMSLHQKYNFMLFVCHPAILHIAAPPQPTSFTACLRSEAEAG